MTKIFKVKFNSQQGSVAPCNLFGRDPRLITFDPTGYYQVKISTRKFPKSEKLELMPPYNYYYESEGSNILPCVSALLKYIPELDRKKLPKVLYRKIISIHFD